MQLQNPEWIVDLYEQVPRYRSHKIVRAAKILAVSGDGSARSPGELHLEIPGRPDPLVLPVDRDYMEKHKPQVGGYYVLYKDGYESWSPANALESGYTLIGPSEDDPSEDGLQEAMDAVKRQLDGEVPLSDGVQAIRDALGASHLEMTVELNQEGYWHIRATKRPPDPELSFGRRPGMPGAVYATDPNGAPI